MQSIIQKLHDDGQLYAFCQSYDPMHYQDVYQETILSLMKLGSEKINTISEKGYLTHYAMKIASNCASVNHKLKRGIDNYLHVEIKDDKSHSIEQRLLDIDLLDRVKVQLSKFPKYDQDIIKLYLRIGSMREMSRETGIPHNTISHWINEIRTELKSHFKEDLI